MACVCTHVHGRSQGMQGNPDRPFVPCCGLVEPFVFPPSPEDTGGGLQEVGRKEEDVGDRYQ